jgi:hypothetical protein
MKKNSANTTSSNDAFEIREETYQTSIWYAVFGLEHPLPNGPFDNLEEAVRIARIWSAARGVSSSGGLAYAYFVNVVNCCTGEVVWQSADNPIPERYRLEYTELTDDGELYPGGLWSDWSELGRYETAKAAMEIVEANHLNLGSRVYFRLYDDGGDWNVPIYDEWSKGTS